MHGKQIPFIWEVRCALLRTDQLQQARLLSSGMEGHPGRLMHNNAACVFGWGVAAAVSGGAEAAAAKYPPPAIVEMAYAGAILRSCSTLHCRPSACSAPHRNYTWRLFQEAHQRLCYCCSCHVGCEECRSNACMCRPDAVKTSCCSVDRLLSEAR